jgi:hypothetical protein
VILRAPPAWPDLVRSAFSAAARPARVSALIVAVVAMSLADLYMTLAHLLHFGMVEVNPLARRIIEQGSAAELIIWKLASILLAVAILFLARHRRSAEVGALACFALLAWLTVHWFNYNATISTFTTDLHTLSDSSDPAWVTFVPAGR